MYLCILTPTLLKLELLVSWSRTETGGLSVYLLRTLTFHKKKKELFTTLVPTCCFFTFPNRYDKREDLSVTSPEVRTYSHLLMEANVTKLELLKDSHHPLAFIEGYNTIVLNLSNFPPVTVRLRRKTVLLERKAQTRVTKVH